MITAFWVTIKMKTASRGGFLIWGLLFKWERFIMMEDFKEMVLWKILVINT